MKNLLFQLLFICFLAMVSRTQNNYNDVNDNNKSLSIDSQCWTFFLPFNACFLYLFMLYFILMTIATYFYARHEGMYCIDPIEYITSLSFAFQSSSNSTNNQLNQNRVEFQRQNCSLAPGSDFSMNMKGNNNKTQNNTTNTIFENEKCCHKNFKYKCFKKLRLLYFLLIYPMFLITNWCYYSFEYGLLYIGEYNPWLFAFIVIAIANAFLLLLIYGYYTNYNFFTMMVVYIYLFLLGSLFIAMLFILIPYRFLLNDKISPSIWKFGLLRNEMKLCFINESVLIYFTIISILVAFVHHFIILLFIIYSFCKHNYSYCNNPIWYIIRDNNKRKNKTKKTENGMKHHNKQNSNNNADNNNIYGNNDDMCCPNDFIDNKNGINIQIVHEDDCVHRDSNDIEIEYSYEINSSRPHDCHLRRNNSMDTIEGVVSGVSPQKNKNDFYHPQYNHNNNINGNSNNNNIRINHPYLGTQTI